MGANMIQRAVGGANADDVNHFPKKTTNKFFLLLEILQMFLGHNSQGKLISKRVTIVIILPKVVHKGEEG